MPMTRAPVASAASSSRVVVRLDERLQAEVPRPIDERARGRSRGVQHGQQQHEVGAGGAQQRPAAARRRRTPWRGRARRRRRGLRVRSADRAAEPVRLAQHGDRGGAAGLVGAGTGDDVVVRGGDRPGRRRAALDLGDQVEARRGEALGESRGRGRRPGEPARRAPDRRPHRARRRRSGPSSRGRDLVATIAAASTGRCATVRAVAPCAWSRLAPRPALAVARRRPSRSGRRGAPRRSGQGSRRPREGPHATRGDERGRPRSGARRPGAGRARPARTASMSRRSRRATTRRARTSRPGGARPATARSRAGHAVGPTS